MLADSYNGKKLNSPNDIVAHPDGSYWFTDPPYGGQLYEGEPDAAGGASNAAGKLNPRIGQPAGFMAGKRELPTNCYRIDPSGRVDLVVTEDQVPDPNGLTFSPDFKKLYVVSTGKGPGDSGPGGKGDVSVFDVGADNKLTNQKRFSDFTIDGVKCGPDGVRCDVNGNVWASSNAGRHVGYNGVSVWSPSGQLLGRIRLPEVCGNICFGGPKRNRLFMAGSQSLYAVYLGTQGAGPGAEIAIILYAGARVERRRYHPTPLGSMPGFRKRLYPSYEVNNERRLRRAAAHHRLEVSIDHAQPGDRRLRRVGAGDHVADDLVGLDRRARLDVAIHRGGEGRTFCR